MELHEYPRPANDTGIGIHWSPGFANAIGMAKLREFWIPELRSLGVKWVKIYNHDGALDLAELLLAEGMMPIVRLYRATPNPGRLGLKELVIADSFVRIGVRYFEFNSEPDRDSEWRGGRVPANGLELAAEDAIANLEALLERGALPAIPALANGSNWDLAGKIIQMGRKDLFDGGVWQAIHNYASNRPLDYPYDIGNQQGAAYTERFYQLLAAEPWDEHAWRGRSLAEINRLRLDRCSPGMTSQEDHACWLAYEDFNRLHRKHLGRSIPILSTECGYIVGEDADPRYPATTPNLHMAQTLEACRVMMGTSQRYSAAPDYYFCTAFWLIANAQLGSGSNWWEKHAWYSSRWPGGALPIVSALKAEVKVVRRWHERGQVGQKITLRGAAINAVGNVASQLGHDQVVLLQNGRQLGRAVLDANHRFVFYDLTPGRYTLRVEGVVDQEIDIEPGQPEVAVNLVFPVSETQQSRSVVQGTVRGGAEAVIVLVRRSDGEEWATLAREDGSFRFVDLPAGEYSVRVSPEGSRLDNLQLDGKNQREVQLAVAGWGYLAGVASEQTSIAAIRCVVEGKIGVAVRAHSGLWSSDPVYTGGDPELGDFECELRVPESGHYIVTVDGVQDSGGRSIPLEARVHVDKRRVPLLKFVYTDLRTPARYSQSSVQGQVTGAPGPSSYSIRLLDEYLNQRDVLLEAEQRFQFDALPAGRYRLALIADGEEIASKELALDGVNHVTLDLAFPVLLTALHASPNADVAPVESGSSKPLAVSSVAGRSVIAAHAPLAAGRIARLSDAAGNTFSQPVGADDAVRFTELPAGLYTLRIDGGYQQEHLTVDGANGLEILFTPLVSHWEVQVSNAGSMPGFSAVRVEVQGMADLPVRIWKDDWDGMQQRTGSRPDYGEFALEFSPLGPGIYLVEPEGLGIWADVELTGLEAMWVSFRSQATPTAPNTVVPLPPSRSKPFAVHEKHGAESAASESPRPTDSGAETSQPNAPALVPAPSHDASGALAANDSTALVAKAALSTYLWIDTQALSGHELAALLRYVAQTQPLIGAEMEAAQQAQQVLIVGDAAYLQQPQTQQLELQLRQKALKVERVAIDDLVSLF
jgi:hypothetical protein